MSIVGEGDTGDVPVNSGAGSVGDVGEENATRAAAGGIVDEGDNQGSTTKKAAPKARPKPRAKKSAKRTPEHAVAPAEVAADATATSQIPPAKTPVPPPPTVTSFAGLVNYSPNDPLPIFASLPSSAPELAIPAPSASFAIDPELLTIPASHPSQTVLQPPSFASGSPPVPVSAPVAQSGAQNTPYATVRPPFNLDNAPAWAVMLYKQFTAENISPNLVESWKSIVENWIRLDALMGFEDMVRKSIFTYGTGTHLCPARRIQHERSALGHRTVDQVRAEEPHVRL